MKILKYLFLLVFVNPLFSQVESNLQSEKFFEDFKIYREVMEVSHSGLYLYTTKAKFDSIYSKAGDMIKNNEISNMRDFNKLLAEVNTHINCGHTNIFPDSVIFSKIKDNQKAFFPLKVKILKDTLIVAEDFGQLKKGSQIISINGKTFNTIRYEMYTVISSDGYNTTLKDRYLEEEFSNYYFLLYGEYETFKLKIKSYGSSEISKIRIAGCDNERREFLLESPELIECDLEFPNETTAILTVNSFDMDQKNFFRFLKESFEEINDKKIRKLIIDIRQNTGGQDGNDTKLASYLISKPFQDNKYRLLNSVALPLYPEYIDLAWLEIMDLPKDMSPKEINEEFNKILDEEYYLGDDNKYYLKDEYICNEKPDNNLFNGTVYILTGGKVFSAGSLFSALVKDKTDAIFVGEETGGGYYRHTGSYPLYYQLPYTKIRFSLSIVVNEQDINRNLMPFGKGVIPDFEVHQTIYEYVNDIDAVMKFVIEN